MMRASRLRVLLAALGIAVSTPAWALLGWEDLAPAATAHPEDNPFERMTESQLAALRELAVSRLLAQRLGQRSEAAAAREQSLIDGLRADGLDAEAMLARRERLMQERRARAEAAVHSVDGAPIRLAGWLVPVALEDDRVREFLLVPWAGACSHTPPPPPNQVVRVRVPAPGLDPTSTPQRGLVMGTVRVRLQVQPVLMVDGMLEVASSYAIDDATVAPLPDSPPTTMAP